MKYLNARAALSFIVLLCFVTRIPQLVSPQLFLDGDECLVGLMAKHMLKGDNVPLFFWGQQYGFTLIECLMIIPFYAILGVTTIATKLAMLSLWTIGVIFLYKTLRLLNKGNDWVPLLLILLFISHPSWATWSMKARGGYLTAFTLSNIILYLCFKDREKSFFTYSIMAVLVVLVYQSHAFWMAGVVPILLYILWTDRNWKAALLIALIFTAITYAFHLYKITLVSVYQPTIIIPDKAKAIFYIKRIPFFLYNSMHGNYYFAFIQKPNFFCALLSLVACAVIFVLPLLALGFFIAKRKQNTLLLLSTAFIFPCLFITLFTDSMECRYLLPVMGFALIPLQLLSNKIKRPGVLLAGTTVLTVAGIVALATFWNFEFMYKRKDTILRTISYLQKNNVKYLFSIDCMIPWQINFYTNETITARMPYIPERYPPNGIKVNDALANGEKTAVMLYGEQMAKLKIQNIEPVNEFFIGIRPTRNDLSELFSFPQQ